MGREKKEEFDTKRKELREEYKETKKINCALKRFSLVFMSRKQAGEKLKVSWDKR